MSYQRVCDLCGQPLVTLPFFKFKMPKLYRVDGGYDGMTSYKKTRKLDLHEGCLNKIADEIRKRAKV